MRHAARSWPQLSRGSGAVWDRGPWSSSSQPKLLAAFFIRDVQLGHLRVAATGIGMAGAGFLTIQFSEIAVPIGFDAEHLAPWFLPIRRRKRQEAHEGTFQHGRATVSL